MTATQSPGRLLTVVATVNDLHFGETHCGLIEGLDVGPVLEADPGDDPYPTVMNRAAAQEIAALGPAAVVAKGDLTAKGAAAEYAEFEAVYRTAFGDRLLVTPGNHDKPAAGSGLPDLPAVQSRELDGVILAVLDTARPGQTGGTVSAEQAAWLDDLAAGADRPVLVFGHHPVEGAGHGLLPGLEGEGAERLVSVVARRPALVGYFAGHTHRNKVRHLPATGDFPWVEVACVKDFPGSWAEYRIHENAVFQVHHRIDSDPAARRWSERCRAMFGGRYPGYALGEESDRSFEIPLRRG